MEQLSGLTNEQVRERRQAGLVNTRVDSATKSVGRIVRSNLFTYFNLIFLVLSVLLVLVRAWTDLLFLPVIISNIAIGIIQEIHSKKVLDQLTFLSTPVVHVIRERERQEVASEELVKDDVVLLCAGAQIPADAVVLSGTLQVNEALLTGESDEVTKKEGEQLLSGSFVVSGKAYARLTNVGKESYLSRLILQATRTKEGEQSEMIRSLNRLIQVMGIIILPIGITLFVQSYVRGGNDLHDSITAMVAAIIGMIPEGLYLLASVALAVSTIRLARGEILVHDMRCIETLARVDVLCLDKTGTITEAAMQVEAVRFFGISEQEAEGLLSDFAWNMPTDNATMEALQNYFKATTGRRANEVLPFSSELKFSGMVLDGQTYLLGAPEVLLGESYGRWKTLVEECARRGTRVVIFGKYAGALAKELPTEEFIPTVMVLLYNPIRRGAKDTFSYFARHGVEIKVISGDHPMTVSATAKRAGISGAEHYIDAGTLRTKKDYERAVAQYTVFGRVQPEQKRAILRELKRQGKTVAMTGDGVNDVLALKDADCSIALASGSEAATQVSQLVLLDSDFSKMPSVVMEGRRVVNNMERTASLYIVKNIFSMLLAIFSMVMVFDYPLMPSQISLISMFTIGIPSFVLALEQNGSRIRGHFLTNVLFRAFPAGMTDFVIVSMLVVFCREFGIESGCLSTACTVLLAVVGFGVLFRVARPGNAFHNGLIMLLIAGFSCCVLFAGRFFAIVALSKQCLMMIFLFIMLIEPLLRYFGHFVAWIYKKGKDFLLQPIEK